MKELHLQYLAQFPMHVFILSLIQTITCLLSHLPNSKIQQEISVNLSHFLKTSVFKPFKTFKRSSKKPRDKGIYQFTQNYLKLTGTIVKIMYRFLHRNKILSFSRMQQGPAQCNTPVFLTVEQEKKPQNVCWLIKSNHI